MVHKPLDTTWHFIQLQLWLWILITNVHEIKYNKNELANEIVGFCSLIFFLNELTIKCVVGFGSFLKL